jgi:hypothetical protein
MINSYKFGTKVRKKVKRGVPALRNNFDFPESTFIANCLDSKRKVAENETGCRFNAR